MKFRELHVRKEAIRRSIFIKQKKQIVYFKIDQFLNIKYHRAYQIKST